MNYKYNEFDYAKTIYENGFQTKYMMTELKLAAVYIRRVLGCSGKVLRQELYTFGAKHIPGYRLERDYVILDRAIRFANQKDSALTAITAIPIYHNELDYLLNTPLISRDRDFPIENEYLCRKVMFTFLVYMKLNTEVLKCKNQSKLADLSHAEATALFQGHSFKGGPRKYNMIKQMANLPVKTDINIDIISRLGRTGLVTILFNGLIRLDYLDDIYKLTQDPGAVVIEVKDFENIGWYLDYYTGQPRMKCCRYCGAPFAQRGNRQEYCGPECSAASTREQTRRRVRRYREKPLP